MRITGVLAFVAGLAVFCSRGVGLPVGYDWQEWPLAHGGNGHFYALTQTCGEDDDGIGTWSEAYSEATSIGGCLATINGSPEQDWLNATFPRTTVGRVDEELWIGLHQLAGSAEPHEGWKWVTGEPVTFTNWYPGEPNEGPPPESNEDCVLMHGFQTGKWIDVPNVYGFGFYGIIEVPADPNVPGFTVETYATWTDNDPLGAPTELAFDESTGALYVGRDDHGAGSLRILRIPPGGTPVLGLPVANYEYGETPIRDPDALIFDALGAFCDTAGSVLVGSGYPGAVWCISPVDPHPVSLLWSSPPVTNPHKMALDNTGRLFISDESAQKIYVSDGPLPTDCVTGLPFNGIAIDAANRVFAGTVDGKIRIYDPNCSGGDEFVIGLAHGSSALAFGRGGCWGTDLYTVSGDELLAIDGGGNVRVLGTGFATAFDIAFGADQAMYISMAEDRILRIVPEPPEPPWYFIQMSDTHVGTPGADDILLDVVDMINDLGNNVNPSPRFVIISGDLTDRGACHASGSGRSATFNRFKQIVDGLNGPDCYLCPGNHDYIPGAFPELNLFRPLCAEADLEDRVQEMGNKAFRLVSIDSGAYEDFVERWCWVLLPYPPPLPPELVWYPSKFDWLPEGTGLTAAQVGWLNGLLADQSFQHNVVFMHHPVVCTSEKEDGFFPGEDYTNGCISHQRTEFLNTCRGKVDVVLGGHTHQLKINGKLVDGWQYTVDAWPPEDLTKESPGWVRIGGNRGYWSSLGVSSRPMYVITGSALDYVYRKIEVAGGEVRVHPATRFPGSGNRMKWEIRPEIPCLPGQGVPLALTEGDSASAPITAPARLHAFDGGGNHVGVKDEGGVDCQLAGAYYLAEGVPDEADAIMEWNEGEIIAFKVGSAERYRVQFESFMEVGLSLSCSFVRDYSAGETAVAYSSVPVFAGSVGVVHVEAGILDPTLYVDDNGDGQTDREIQPSEIVCQGVPYPPARPAGPTQTVADEECTYSTSTTDPEGDQVYLNFDWGDGTESGWVGPCDSGAASSASHAWSEAGTYKVRARGRDIDGHAGDWSEGLWVNVAVPVHADIKPGSCPNALNRGSHGVLPVAVLGTESFDVSSVDLSSVRLSRADGVGGRVAPHEGPPGPHTVISDVGTPFDGQACGCHELEGDGIDDLSMKFKVDELVPALQLDSLSPGALVELVVTGNLLDGRRFMGRDCVRLVPPNSPPVNLLVSSTAPGAWFDVSPLDLRLDGGGFANPEFTRSFPETSVVTVAAAAEFEGRPFTGWRLNGASEPLPGRSVSVTMVGDQAIEAVYSPLAVSPGLVSSDPAADGTLPKTQNNVMLLTFDGPITLPGGPALTVKSLPDNTDVGGSFTYTVQPDGVTLKAKENGTVLTNLNWYRVTPGTGFNVQPFTRDFCALQGDADGSGQVLAPDYFQVKNNLFQTTDARYDLDGSGQVLAPDYFVVKNKLFDAKPPKP